MAGTKEQMKSALAEQEIMLVDLNAFTAEGKPIHPLIKERIKKVEANISTLKKNLGIPE